MRLTHSSSQEGFTASLEDVMPLTMLTVLGDRNAMGKVLDGEDDAKL